MEHTFFFQNDLVITYLGCNFSALFCITKKNDGEWPWRSYDNADLAQMIPSIRISNFDHSFTDNCLSVYQTNDCSSVGNLGHLLRKPTPRILLHTTHRHLSLRHLHIEKWLQRQMYIPGGPIDMTQKITHCWDDIFRPVLLCWAKHRGISEWLPI